LDINLDELKVMKMNEKLYEIGESKFKRMGEWGGLWEYEWEDE